MNAFSRCPSNWVKVRGLVSPYFATDVSICNERQQTFLDARLAYATLRAILGLNIFLHGLVRVPSLGGFADGLVQGFADTILPAVLVRAFAYALVPLEVVIGALVLVGWKTRWALVAGQLVMAALVFEKALRQDWSTLGRR